MSCLSLTVDAEPGFLLRGQDGFIFKTISGFGIRSYRIVKETDNQLKYFNFQVNTTEVFGEILSINVPFIESNFSAGISNDFPVLPTSGGTVISRGVYKLYSVSNGEIRELPARIAFDKTYKYNMFSSDFDVEFIYFRTIDGVQTWVNHRGNPLPGHSFSGDVHEEIAVDEQKRIVFLEVTETPNIVYIEDPTISNDLFASNPVESQQVGGNIYEITLLPIAIKSIDFVAHLRIKNSSGNYITTVTNFTLPENFSIVKYEVILNYYRFVIRYSGTEENAEFNIT